MQESALAELKVEQAPDMLTVGRQVIAQEIQGLKALADGLAAPFEQTIQLLLGLRGKLVVSGMGKSGHVARKIAATFASTGTPAFFVHPGEASHGDLGMIGPQDALMLLSNSGETAELNDMIHYACRAGIPLIAVVRRKSSVLVEAATIAMVLPETPEASSIGAPTTSTTMMMVLGDALAVGLMEKRGFTREDFGQYHPGGKLGKAFIRVRDLMHGGEGLPKVAPGLSMRDVLIEMTVKGLGCAGVVGTDGLLLGIITDGDLRRHMRGDLLECSAAEIMTRNPLTIRPGALASEALAVMNSRSITNLFVVEEGVPHGVIHIHDCLRAGIV